MGRIITVKKVEAERQKAVQYIKSSILYPSVFLGLLSIILGYGALIYLLFSGRHLAQIVADSFILLGFGLLLGWFQFLYHRFLLEHYPEYYAERRRKSEQVRAGRFRKFGVVPKPVHRGRWLIPYLYWVAFIGFIALAVYYSMRLNAMAAIFLPLAGFYNLRFFFWKRKLHL